MSPEALAALLLGALLLAQLVHLTLRRRGELRPLPALGGLPGLIARAAEMGMPAHLSLGTGEVGAEEGGLVTLASLSLVEGMADRATRGGAPLLVSSASGTGLALGLSLLGRLQARDPGSSQARLLGLGPAAYAAAGLGHTARSPDALILLAGEFGPEYLPLGEAARRRGVPLYAGGTDPVPMADQVLTAGEPLVGEELFAAAAYRQAPEGLARLAAQDWLRWALAAAILLGAAARW